VLLGTGGSFKSQLKKADAHGARFALIIGDDEVAAGNVTRKNMRDGTQETVSRETLVNSGKS
jgi:histidyl-tRNA synthetase